jgi:hypothetical protein
MGKILGGPEIKMEEGRGNCIPPYSSLSLSSFFHFYSSKKRNSHLPLPTINILFNIYMFWLGLQVSNPGQRELMDLRAKKTKNHSAVCW